MQIGNWQIKRLCFIPSMLLPYKIATLLYCFNERDEVLLLERTQEPNLGLWTPWGGELHTESGESAYACAWPAAEELAAVAPALPTCIRRDSSASTATRAEASGA